MNSHNRLIRELLLYEFELGHNAAQATRNICHAKGEGSVDHSTATRWFKKFRSGDRNLDDQPRSGRPRTVDSEAVRQAVEANPTTSTRRLSGELGISQTTVVRRLQDLGKVYRSCRIVPHELTPAEATRRVEVCTKLLDNPRDVRFIKRIVTCDEKWVFFRNPNTQRQWLSRGQLPEPVAKRGRFEHKVMLCVWWNFEGILHYEFVPDGRTINANLYSEQLGRMYAVLEERYPALVNRKRALLQQDNARPHTARTTRAKLQELEGIELMPHPAYSPDLAPSDYYLFRSMAHFLRGRQFNNQEEVEAGVKEFFASKDKTWYRRGIEELADRWLKTVQHDGLYFEC